jgi:hypothetical protein
MGGGLMQLVAYGSQDVYLTGNPQITYFKLVYRRHTNFSIEPIQQVFNGIANWGHSVSATIARNGDLLYRMYITITLPSVPANSNVQFRWLNWLGHIIVQQAEIVIGGQKIDRHVGTCLILPKTQSAARKSCLKVDSKIHAHKSQVNATF